MATKIDPREVIREQQEELDRIFSAPMAIGAVVNLTPQYVFIVADGKTQRVQRPSKLKLKIGARVLLMQETGAILEVLDDVTLQGQIVTADEVLPDGFVVVNINGSLRRLPTTDGLREQIKNGSRVVLDDTGSAVVDVLRAKETPPPEIATTTYEDIAGQTEAKEALQELIELPRKYPELHKAYGKKGVKGVLLYGPPGCGKTMLGKALAHSLDGGFISVRGPELLDPYVGATEAAIRDLFHQADDFKAETGRPAVIFIDECDAILGVRGGHNSFMEKTVVPMFLTMMDGLTESSAVVVLATNRPDQLDPAVTREGRIDRKVLVDRPDAEAARALFELYLSNGRTALAKDMSAASLAALGTEELMTGRPLYDVTFQDGSSEKLAMKHVVSGALIAGIVEQATAHALRRDITAGAKVPTGVTAEDISEAVARVYKQSRDVHHDDEIEKLADGRRVTKKEKVRAETA